eukprot:scaffold11238_cov297-Chaetoceros_neogracile.AAC.2
MSKASQQRRFNINRSRKKTEPNQLLRILVILLGFCFISFLTSTYILQQETSKSQHQHITKAFVIPTKNNDSLDSQIVSQSLPRSEQQSTLALGIPEIPNSQHAYTISPIETQLPLPKWVQEYISWHQKMRSDFPGQSIITDPNAPPVLVRTCLGLCGGLHDRLGQLPLDLYLANQTKRVLLIKWIKPQPLEEFLIPPSDGIDWVFPSDVEGWGTKCNTLNLCAKQVRVQPQILGNNVDSKERKSISFQFIVEEGIKQLNGKLKDIKAVTYQILGHLDEDYLEQRLRELGETDMIHGTASFGNIFRKFFQPHPNVQNQIDEANKKYCLVPGEYSVCHCRVRHPKAYKTGETFDGKYIANADKLGLPFEGRFRDLAVDLASRAIQCTATLPDVDNHPIYFMADESELVRYLTRHLMNATYISEHADWFDDPHSTNSTAKEIMSHHHVVARDQDIKNAHIDKNKGRPPEEYYGTFVDLYLGIQARCVVFGVGNYALFASKLGGRNCKMRYAKELWGGENTTHKRETQECALP